MRPWYTTLYRHTLVSCVLVLCTLSFKTYSVSSHIHPDLVTKLSLQEIEWLSKAPTINYTGHPHYLPFEDFSKNANHIGIAADYLDDIEELTGLRFHRISTSNLVDALQLAVNNKVDLISGDLSDLILNKHYSPISTYASNNIALVMRNKEPAVNSLYDVEHQGLALVVGYGYSERLKQEYPTIAFREFDTVRKGLDAVSSGLVGGILLPRTVSAYHLTTLGYSDLKFAGATAIDMSFGLFVDPQEHELKSILEKALGLITPNRRVDIAAKWSTPTHQSGDELRLVLSKKERDYLKQISPIRFTGDPNWLPYEAFDENNHYIGQVADHLDIIQSLLGVEFEITPTRTWAESVELMREAKVDILSETDSSVLNNEVFFTQSYSSSPIVIVMRYEENHVEDVNQLTDKNIALVKDYGNTVEIKKTYPEMSFSSVNTIQEGLIGVSTGAIDGMLLNSSQAIFNIKYLGLNNIKIVGKTTVETRLAFAINKNRGQLVNIINRALDIIKNSPQQQAIYDKWNSVEYAEKVDYTLVYQVLMALISVIILALIWGRKLKKDIDERQRIANELSLAKEQANKANLAKTRFLAIASHELRTPLNGILGMLDLLERSNLSKQQHYMAHIAKNSSENLLGILNDILDISKIEVNKMDIVEKPSSIRELVETCVNTHIQNIYNKGLYLTLDIGPPLGEKFMIDPLRIRQIINNFLSNAIKFTHTGGITIRAYLENEDQQHLVICVSDTGIGIDKKDQAHLFQEFVQLNNSDEYASNSSGLGLNISYRLSQLMGGEILLSSEKHQGTEIQYRQAITSLEERSSQQHWLGRNIAIVIENLSITAAIQGHCEYYGAIVTAPALVIKQRAWIENLLEQEDIELLLIDQQVADQCQLETLDTTEIIYLTHSQDLSTNRIDAGHYHLNTNPLQPSFLVLSIDTALGIANKELEAQADPDTQAIKPITLLVAEDHPTNRALIAEQLDYLGYQYTLVSNGQEALDALENHDYDALLTDCQMPVVNGYELACQVRKDHKTFPIIAMTANAISQERSHCLEAGMDDILAKPLVLNTLSDCLEQHLDHRCEGKCEEKSKLSRPIAPNDSLLLDSYIKATTDDIEQLKACMAKEDRAGLKATSHRMLGAAKTMDIAELVELIQQLDNGAPTLSWNQIGNLLDRLIDSFTIYQDVLKRTQRIEDKV